MEDRASAMPDMEGYVSGDITHSADVTKIVKALIEARKSMPQIVKSGHNAYDNYDYLRFDDLVGPVTEALLKNDIILVTGIRSIHPGAPRPGKNTTQYVMLVELTLKLLHSSGQWIQILAAGEGQDRGDKATYKGVTGARKYGLCMVMSLGGGDDPEYDTSQPAASRPVTPPSVPQVRTKPAPRPAPRQQQQRMVPEEQISSASLDDGFLDQKMFGKRYSHLRWGDMLQPEEPDEEQGGRLSYCKWLAQADQSRFNMITDEHRRRAARILEMHQEGQKAMAQAGGYTPDDAPDDPSWDQSPPPSDEDVF